MFFDKYEDVELIDLIAFVGSLDDTKWTLLIWNTQKDKFDEKDVDDIIRILDNFEDDEPFSVSANLTMSSKNRMYIKHTM